jgi:hypothetical protein
MNTRTVKRIILEKLVLLTRSLLSLVVVSQAMQLH